MSDDPRRWALDGAGSTREERELLRAAAGAPVDPPPGSEKAVWAALALHVGAGGAGAAGGAGGSGGAGAAGGAGAGQAAGTAAAGGGGAAAGGSAAGAAGAAGMIKSVLIGAASAGLLIAGYTALGPDSPAPPSTEPEVAVVAPSNPDAIPAGPRPPAPPPAETAAPVTSSVNNADPVDPPAERAGRPSPSPAEAAPRAETETAPAPSPPSTSESAPSAAPSSQPLTPAERANLMREESLLLGEARDALRRGDPSAALAKLEEARARFGGSMLGQEREALTIEALHKSGQKAAASARAAAFLRANPLSPHAARLQAFVQ